jgi:hypothetical protein
VTVRRVLLVTHGGRADAITLAREVAADLSDAGIEVRAETEEAAELVPSDVVAVDASVAAEGSSSAATARSCAAPRWRAPSTSPSSGSTSVTSGSSPRPRSTR